MQIRAVNNLQSFVMMKAISNPIIALDLGVEDFGANLGFAGHWWSDLVIEPSVSIFLCINYTACQQ